MIALLSALAASSLISAIWQGMILAACVALCLHLLPQTTAAMRSFVWTAVLLLVVALHFAANAMQRSPGFASSHGLAVHLNFHWSVAVFAVWILFSIVRGSQLVVSAVRLYQMERNATPIDGGPACAAILHSAHRSAILCTSTEVDGPSVIGFVSPRILIPAALLEKLSPSELQQVVLHEMEHLRRGDDWINLLQKISLVLFPLNPVLQWIERRLCIERELACDDGVLRCTRAPKAYATCLANLAEHSMLHRRASLALRAWERHSELASRVRRILQRPALEIGQSQAKMMIGALVLVLVGGATALSHCPQLVTFSPSLVSPGITTAPRLLAPSHFQDAVFHPGNAHPLAISATMPEKQPAKEIPVRKIRHRKSLIRHQEDRRAVLSSWVLVTYWNANPPASSVKFAVIETSQPFFDPSLDLSGRGNDAWVVVQL
jgi:beta-lactamase regulating signal transducer with metallopeptidase domain